MEIDPRNKTMWIIDVGRVDTMESGIYSPNNKCGPKIVIVDLTTGTVLARHYFPESVASQSQNFLNDIVLDPEKKIAYISNPGENSIVVYNWPENRGHKVVVRDL